MCTVRLPRWAAGLLIPALTVTAVLAAAPEGAAAASNGTGCAGYSASGGWWVQCQAAGHAPAAASGGGHQVCTWSPDVKGYYPGFTANAPKAPPGYTYLIEICGKTYGLPQLVATGGAVTAAALAQQAYRELRPPLPGPQTAPPRGRDGLVGLPEWFWVPRRQWVPLHREVTAGGVWAEVTATPARLVFSPGSGQAPLACAGPGTAFIRSQPASGQHSNCTYTYTQSSAGLPGRAYAAAVTITWTATWAGSGGSGGTLPPLTRTTMFRVPVAEAQSLNGA